MAESGIMTLPLLRGHVALPSTWGTYFARSDMRVYPYQLGAMVRANTSTTTLLTHGKGEFAINDYFIACSVVSYGDSDLFIPDLNRVGRIVSLSGSDDLFVITPALILVAGEYLLNIGNDSGGANPAYDMSDVNLWTDNVGNSPNGNKFLTTGTDGRFRGWVDSGYEAVDLLITDEANVPKIIVPFHPLGPEIVP